MSLRLIISFLGDERVHHTAELIIFLSKKLCPTGTIDQKYCIETCQHRLTTTDSLNLTQTLFFTKLDILKPQVYSFFTPYYVLPNSPTLLSYHSTISTNCHTAQMKKIPCMFSLIGTIVRVRFGSNLCPFLMHLFPAFFFSVYP